MHKTSFLERLDSGGAIVMDGAINTELAARGLVFNAHDWLRINIDQPQIVADIHASYARAGAELHIANSFATAKHVTEHYGFAGNFEDLNKAAVELCRQAIDSAASHPQWIAGSISTYAPDHDRNKLPPADIFETNCREQASILAHAGCDLIALEMVADATTGAAMLRGAAAAGLPVSVGVVCGQTDAGDLVFNYRNNKPVAFVDGVSKILDAAPADACIIATVMHSDTALTTRALEAVRQIWPGKLCAYPHTGKPDGVGGWDLTEACTEEEFTQCCVEAVGLGACIVGGCCGIGPDYIRTLVGRV